MWTKLILACNAQLMYTYLRKAIPKANETSINISKEWVQEVSHDLPLNRTRRTLPSALSRFPQTLVLTVNEHSRPSNGTRMQGVVLTATEVGQLPQSLASMRYSALWQSRPDLVQLNVSCNGGPGRILDRVTLSGGGSGSGGEKEERRRLW